MRAHPLPESSITQKPYRAKSKFHYKWPFRNIEKEQPSIALRMSDLQVLEVLGALVLARRHVNGLQLPIVDILLHQGGEHTLGAGRVEGSVDGDSHGVCK